MIIKDKQKSLQFGKFPTKKKQKTTYIGRSSF